MAEVKTYVWHREYKGIRYIEFDCGKDWEGSIDKLRTLMTHNGPISATCCASLMNDAVAGRAALCNFLDCVRGAAVCELVIKWIEIDEGCASRITETVRSCPQLSTVAFWHGRMSKISAGETAKGLASTSSVSKVSFFCVTFDDMAFGTAIHFLGHSTSLKVAEFQSVHAPGEDVLCVSSFVERCRTLQRLVISHFPRKILGGCLATAIRNHANLVYLEIGKCMFANGVFSHIIAALSARANMVDVQLSCNHQDYTDADMAAVLASNHTLERINLYGNSCTSSGMECSIRQIATHPSLRAFSIGISFMSSHQVSDLGRAVIANKNIFCFFPYDTSDIDDRRDAYLFFSEVVEDEFMRRGEDSSPCYARRGCYNNIYYYLEKNPPHIEFVRDQDFSSAKSLPEAIAHITDTPGVREVSFLGCTFPSSSDNIHKKIK